MDRPVTGHRTAVFLTVWFGQLVSLIGSGLTGFGLGVWVYQRTGSVTLFSLIALCTTLPGIVLSSFAGALVDRWDRRRVMIYSDPSHVSISWRSVCCSSRAIRTRTYLSGTAINSICRTFQWLAYAATVSTVGPKQHLDRANGILELAQATGRIFSPALAGFLVTWLHIHGVLLIDAATFLFSLITLLLVRLPQPEPTTIGTVGRKLTPARSRLWLELHHRTTRSVRATPALHGGQLSLGHSSRYWRHHWCWLLLRPRRSAPYSPSA